MSVALIPPNTLANLDLAPAGVRTVLLIRHAHRPEIPLGSFGAEVDITPDGARVAEELGSRLSRYRVDRLHASPIARCLNTARAIARGAGWLLAPKEDMRLASPFIADGELAVDTYARKGLTAVVAQQLAGSEPPPGFRPTHEGVQVMIEAMMEGRAEDGCLDVLVTHDANLAVLAGYLLGDTVDEASWPAFLEGMFAWRSGPDLGIAWRGRAFRVAWPGRVATSHGQSH